MDILIAICNTRMPILFSAIFSSYASCFKFRRGFPLLRKSSCIDSLKTMTHMTAKHKHSQPKTTEKPFTLKQESSDMLNCYLRNYAQYSYSDLENLKYQQHKACTEHFSESSLPHNLVLQKTTSWLEDTISRQERALAFCILEMKHFQEIEGLFPNRQKM